MMKRYQIELRKFTSFLFAFDSFDLICFDSIAGRKREMKMNWAMDSHQFQFRVIQVHLRIATHE